MLKFLINQPCRNFNTSVAFFSEYKHRNWLVNEHNIIEDPDRSLCNYRTEFVKKRQKQASIQADKNTQREKVIDFNRGC